MMSTKHAWNLPLNGPKYHKATERIRVPHFEQREGGFELRATNEKNKEDRS